MATAPLSIKLRCTSWQQLQTIYKRDLSRSAMFLKSSNPPPLGTMIRIDLTLPSESMIVLNGVVTERVVDGGMGGRGPGVDIKLHSIPQSAMWLIETALSSQKLSRAATAPPVAQAVAPTVAPIAPQAPPAGKPAGPAMSAVSKKSTGPIPALGRGGSLAGARPPTDSGEVAYGDGVELSSAEEELIIALTAELGSLAKLNPYQVLGVGYQADDAEVRAAFGTLTKRYHPDRYTRYASITLRQLAAEIFIVVSDSYRRLGTEALRAQVLQQLGRTTTPRPVGAGAPPAFIRATTNSGATPARTPGQRAPTAPVTVHTGGNPTPQAQRVVPTSTAPTSNPAIATARPKATRVGNESGSNSALSTVLIEIVAIDALLDARKYDQALFSARALAQANPGDRAARASLELSEGMFALESHARLEAAQHFEMVLELDPSNERAARELAEMRRHATNERKGLLTRLLGKKE